MNLLAHKNGLPDAYGGSSEKSTYKNFPGLNGKGKAPAEAEVKPLFPPAMATSSSPQSSCSPPMQPSSPSLLSSSSTSVVEKDCTGVCSMGGTDLSFFQAPSLADKTRASGKKLYPTQKVSFKQSLLPPRTMSRKKSITDNSENPGIHEHFLMEKNGYPDWNVRFKAVISLPKNTAHERLRKAVEERRLYKDFTEKATKIAKVLIKEMNEPPSKKTYKPVKKADTNEYIVEGIYFKFSRDWKRFYGGDQFSAKIADHELLSIRSVIELEQPGIYALMMVIIDYCGYRMTAMPLLPISQSTLVYGSGDKGENVIDRDPEFRGIMDIVARKLNLKQHVVNADGLKLSTPGDLEGHLGTDGAYYLRNVARLFPPVAPENNVIFVPVDNSRAAEDLDLPGEVFEDNEKWIRNLERVFQEYDISGRILRKETGHGFIWYEDTEELNTRATNLVGLEIHGNAVLLRRNNSNILYQLLRPELVKGCSVPLCSDAWTLFQRYDPDCRKHDSEVLAITRDLFTGVIPRFAENLNKHIVTFSRDEDLFIKMHQEGINIRFLGKVRNRVTLPHIKSTLLTEMIGRVCKNELRGLLRRNSALPEDVRRRNIVDYFNVMLGNSRESDNYWLLNIKTKIQYKFIDALDEDEAMPSYDLRNGILLFSLMRRVAAGTGVLFKRGAYLMLFENPNMFERERPLSYSDYEGLTTIVKTSAVFSDNISELIGSSVTEEEVETKRIVEQIGDHQALAAFKALSQLKIHRRIETLLGSDSKEAVESFFGMARRYLKSGSYAMALDAAIKGTSYGEDLFGVFSDVATEGYIVIGNIYEKRNDFLNAVKYYKRALLYVQRLHKQHPLIGILCSKIYFLGSVLQKTQVLSGPLLIDVASIDPEVYLRQSFTSFNDMFGTNAACAMIPLLGFEHSDPEFTHAIQEFLKMPDSPQSFARSSAQMWPKDAIAAVGNFFPSSYYPPQKPFMSQQPIKSSSGIASLLAHSSGNITNPNDAAIVQRALEILSGAATGLNDTQKSYLSFMPKHQQNHIIHSQQFNIFESLNKDLSNENNDETETENETCDTNDFDPYKTDFCGFVN